MGKKLKNDMLPEIEKVHKVPSLLKDDLQCNLFSDIYFGSYSLFSSFGVFVKYVVSSLHLCRFSIWCGGH